MTIELTCDLVRTWLDGKKDRQMVGFPGRADSCPLALCLNELQPGSMSMVFTWDYSVATLQGERHRQKTPKWAVNFIDRADQLRTKTVTARRAKAILEEVCQS